MRTSNLWLDRFWRYPHYRLVMLICRWSWSPSSWPWLRLLLNSSTNNSANQCSSSNKHRNTTPNSRNTLTGNYQQSSSFTNVHSHPSEILLFDDYWLPTSLMISLASRPTTELLWTRAETWRKSDPQSRTAASFPAEVTLTSAMMVAYTPSTMLPMRTDSKPPELIYPLHHRYPATSPYFLITWEPLDNCKSSIEPLPE